MVASPSQTASSPLAPVRRGWLRAPASVLLQAVALAGAIAALDILVSDQVPFGWLYVAPVALAATVLGRIPLLLLAAACTVLAECFDGYRWDWASGAPRDALYFSAFAGAALVVHGAMRGRRSASLHMRALEEEMAGRRDAEEQLRVLVENSPVAVFTADAQGRVLLANEAADRLFALKRGALAGQNFAPFLPPLLDLPTLHSPAFHTAMQCRGHRANGEIFQADVWFSTYGTTTGPRLAVFVADSSEDLRDREEASLHQMLTGSRILVGAVSHEVRNVCAAIAVVHENLRRDGSLAGSKDFEALGTLVLALERIASVELREAANQLAVTDLGSLLEEVQIVIAPALRENEIALGWEVPGRLPPVWADRQSLLQVLLNLVKNSERALGGLEAGERLLTLRVYPEGKAGGAEPARVVIAVCDTGPGVPHPEFLFKPFQQGARATGLGLYLSRALMRSFGGDLHYRPGRGATFLVELPLAPPSQPTSRP